MYRRPLLFVFSIILHNTATSNVISKRFFQPSSSGDESSPSSSARLPTFMQTTPGRFQGRTGASSIQDEPTSVISNPEFRAGLPDYLIPSYEEARRAQRGQRSSQTLTGTITQSPRPSSSEDPATFVERFRIEERAEAQFGHDLAPSARKLAQYHDRKLDRTLALLNQRLHKLQQQAPLQTNVKQSERLKAEYKKYCDQKEGRLRSVEQQHLQASKGTRYKKFEASLQVPEARRLVLEAASLLFQGHESSSSSGSSHYYPT